MLQFVMKTWEIVPGGSITIILVVSNTSSVGNSSSSSNNNYDVVDSSGNRTDILLEFGGKKGRSMLGQCLLKGR